MLEQIKKIYERFCEKNGFGHDTVAINKNGNIVLGTTGFSDFDETDRIICWFYENLDDREENLILPWDAVEEEAKINLKKYGLI